MMPPAAVGKSIWEERLADIARFEDYLTRQGVVILKFLIRELVVRRAEEAVPQTPR